MSGGGTLAAIGLWVALAALALALHYGEQLAERLGARRSARRTTTDDAPPWERDASAGDEEGDAA